MLKCECVRRSRSAGMSVGLADSRDFSVNYFGFLGERVGQWVCRWVWRWLWILWVPCPTRVTDLLAPKLPPRPARDFTIWATISLTRSNLSQNLFPVGEVMKVLARSPHGRCHPTAGQVQDLLRVISRLLRFDQHFRKGF